MEQNTSVPVCTYAYHFVKKIFEDGFLYQSSPSESCKMSLLLILKYSTT